MSVGLRLRICVGVGIGIGIERSNNGALSPEDNAKAKILLDRIVAMLTKLGQRGYTINEDSAQYGMDLIDPDSDTDPDPGGSKEYRDSKSEVCKKCV